MRNYLRAYRVEDANIPDEPGQPLRFIASTEGAKRDGKSLELKRWNFDNYRRNPVVLWAHDYMGVNLPIGRAEVWVDEGQRAVVTDVTFDPADELARRVESKYRAKFLNAVSVGWLDEGAGDSLRHDLLDISAVPVPGDPDALAIRSLAAQRQTISDLIAMDGVGALPPHGAPISDQDEWDAAAVVSAAQTPDALRAIHAWRNPTEDQRSPTTYRLPHHDAEGHAVWRGIADAMSALFLDAAQIPEADRRGVYSHLARHYSQAGKTPPEYMSGDDLKSLTVDQVQGLFLEGEGELCAELFTASKARKGAVLNSRNKADLEEAMRLIARVLESAGAQPEAEEESAAQRDALRRFDALLGSIKLQE